MAKSATYTANLATGQVSTSGVTDDPNAIASVTLSNDLLTRLAIRQTGANITIDEAAGGGFADFGPIIGGASASGAEAAFFVDDEDAGYDHQTHGVWITGYGTGAGTAGVGSFGSNSPSLPTTGSASYNGVATGLYADSTGAAISVAAFSATTDFSSVNIQTTGTQLVDIDDGSTLGTRSELDFAGSGSVSGTGFTANVAGTATSGQASGQFYGPNAEEVGGTYMLMGGSSSHVGSFGGN